MIFYDIINLLIGLFFGYYLGYNLGKDNGIKIGLKKAPLMIFEKSLERGYCIICGKKK
jgi:hypothetical protein